MVTMMMIMEILKGRVSVKKLNLIYADKKIPNTELRILTQSLFNPVIPDFFFSRFYSC